MVTTILEMAKFLAGDRFSEGEEEILKTLCQAAFDRWLGRLRPGLSAEDCADALVPACAWTALAGYLAGRDGAEPVKAFSAGDLSIQYGQESVGQAGRQLICQAELMMIPYTADDSFSFRGVRG